MKGFMMSYQVHRSPHRSWDTRLQSLLQCDKWPRIFHGIVRYIYGCIYICTVPFIIAEKLFYYYDVS